MSISNEKQRSPPVVQYALHPIQHQSQSQSVNLQYQPSPTAPMTTASMITATNKNSITSPILIESDCSTSNSVHKNGTRNGVSNNSSSTDDNNSYNIVSNASGNGVEGGSSGKKPVTVKLLKGSRDDYRSYGAEDSPSKQPLIAKNQSSVTVQSFEQEQNTLQGGKSKRM